MKERKKQQKGITLVALVITIIILLILAGISISALTNQGLFTQAQNAKNLTEEKTAEENEILTNYLDQMNAIIGGKYTAYAVGDQVTVGGESFYVIKASGTNEEKVTLLAEKNLDISALTQSDSADIVDFASECYWASIEGITYPYDLNGLPTLADTDAIAIARAYGIKKGGTGRLMTIDEAVSLGAAVIAAKIALIS